MSDKLAYTVAEVAVLTGFSRSTATRIFERERGVLMLGTPERRGLEWIQSTTRKGKIMASFVEELQRDAFNSKIKVSDLLRKAKAIAVKLELPELEKWTDSELYGYEGYAVPSYRIFVGQVQGDYPYWTPVRFANAETEETFSKQTVRDRVAEMESVVAQTKSLRVYFPLAPETKKQLSKSIRTSNDFRIETITNTVLDWSLRLEKAGVKGEGLSFSNDERKKAHETQAVYNIGRIETFTGNMGSGSGNFTVEGNTINADSKAAIQDLIGRIRSSEGQLELKSAPAKSLNQALDGLQHEIGSSKPSTERVKEFLASIRNIAEGAVGSLTAQGILYELSKLMS
jgi:hypothetical protein